VDWTHRELAPGFEFFEGEAHDFLLKSQWGRIPLGEDQANANEGLADVGQQGSTAMNVDLVEDNVVGVESSSGTTSVRCVVGWPTRSYLGSSSFRGIVLC
jgi:hypothetical protein